MNMLYFCSVAIKEAFQNLDLIRIGFKVTLDIHWNFKKIQLFPYSSCTSNASKNHFKMQKTLSRLFFLDEIAFFCALFLFASYRSLYSFMVKNSSLLTLLIGI
jgi:hypothetical protein